MSDLIISDTFTVGDVVPVGEFFWIPNADLIGWDQDARHGNGPARSSGSVSPDCKLTIRGIEGDYAIVRLDRPSVPYGAPASIGTVFKIALSTMQEWPEMIARRTGRERQRVILSRKYCR